MKTKKMTAPTRAGRETEALVQLDWLRTNRPGKYDQIMVALAQLVAIARGIND